MQTFVGKNHHTVYEKNKLIEKLNELSDSWNIYKKQSEITFQIMGDELSIAATGNLFCTISETFPEDSIKRIFYDKNPEALMIILSPKKSSQNKDSPQEVAL